MHISWNLLRAFGYTKPKRKTNTWQSFLPIPQQYCPSAGGFPALATAVKPYGLTCSPYGAAEGSRGADSALCLQIPAHQGSKERLQMLSVQSKSRYYVRQSAGLWVPHTSCQSNQILPWSSWIHLNPPFLHHSLQRYGCRVWRHSSPYASYLLPQLHHPKWGPVSGKWI